MKSFFSRIQNKFDASYGGRYIEQLLLEISQEDISIAKFLGGTKEKCYLKTEYQFSVNGKKRIADIVIMSFETNTVISMVEIKYDDHKNLKNLAQLKDYVNYCKLNKCDFIYLTQYHPPSIDLDLVKESGFKHLLFSHIAEQFKKSKTKPLTLLFVNYLEDKGLCMKKVDNDSLYKYLVRLFNPVSGQKKIQSNPAMIEGIPDAFHAIMNNMSVLSQEISEYTDCKRSPVIDFRSWPSFKFTKKRLKALLEDENSDHIGFLSNKEKYGGELLVFAKSVIINRAKDKDEWLYIEYGYQLSIIKGANEFTSHLYAEIYGRQIDCDDSDLFIKKKIGNGIMSNKEKCLHNLSQLINQVSTKAIEFTNAKAYKNALNALAKSSRKFF